MIFWKTIEKTASLSNLFIVLYWEKSSNKLKSKTFTKAKSFLGQFWLYIKVILKYKKRQSKIFNLIEFFSNKIID